MLAGGDQAGSADAHQAGPGGKGIAQTGGVATPAHPGSGVGVSAAAVPADDPPPAPAGTGAHVALPTEARLGWTATGIPLAEATVTTMFVDTLSRG